MFGFLNFEQRHIKSLRSQLEDTRQRALFRMSPFEQYGLCSVFANIPNEITDEIESLSNTDLDGFRKLGQSLMDLAKQGYNENRAMAGSAGLAGMAGAQGLAILAIETICRGYRSPEAGLLRADAQRLRMKLVEFYNSRSSGQLLTIDDL